MSIAYTGLLKRTEERLEKYQGYIWVGVTLLGGLFAYLHFNGNLTFATDDAEYIRRAYLFLHEGRYPSYQGPLYPLVLSLIMAFTGVHLLAFKWFSWFCFTASIFVTGWAFKNRVPVLVWGSVLLFLAVNPYFIYYGSQTFNEAFVMLLHAAYVGFVFRFVDKLETNSELQQSWFWWLILGVASLIISLAKSIDIVAPLILVVYFGLHRNWKAAGITVLAVGSVRGLYVLTLRGIFNIQPTSQFPQLLRKDFYNPSAGNEDVAGFIARFAENVNQYLSIHFYKILGWRSPTIGPDAGPVPETNLLLTLILAVALVFSLIYLFKWNRYAFISLLFAGSVGGAIFFAVQSFWNQDRLILPYLPYILVALYTMLFFLFNQKWKNFQFAALIAIPLLSLWLFPYSVEMAGENSTARKHYMDGQYTYGANPAIIQFANLCRWAGNKLKESENKVATQKPGEAFVFAGENIFSRVPSMQNKSADEALSYLKENGFTHLMLDPFGGGAGQAAQIIYRQYPEKLEVIQQAKVGQQSLLLIKIHYDH